jgi:hypothetical protein
MFTIVSQGILAGSLLWGIAVAQDVPPPLPKLSVEYSVDRVMVNDTGETIIQKVYAKPEKARIAVMENGVPHAMIIDKKKKIAYMLMPSAMMYIEIPLEALEVNPISKNNRNIEAHSLGEEMVNGMVTTHYEVKGTTKEGEESFEGEVWVTAEGIRMKSKGTVDQRGKIVQQADELFNVIIADQPSGLFEIPDNFLKAPGIPPPPAR